MNPNYFDEVQQLLDAKAINVKIVVDANV
jgi:hypothetical protein